MHKKDKGRFYLPPTMFPTMPTDRTYPLVHVRAWFKVSLVVGGSIRLILGYVKHLL